jgi:octaprenyl-diphosphate synthase
MSRSAKQLVETRKKERLHRVILRRQFRLYRELGIEEAFSNILKRVPKQYRRPITHTQLSIPYRQNSLFIYAIAPANYDHDKLVMLCAVMEMFWTLAVAYDDIIDRDRVRYGKAAAWTRYGTLTTRKSLRFGLRAVAQTVGKCFGERSSRSAIIYFNKAARSLAEHRRLSLQSTLKQCISDYAQRFEFIATYPAGIIYASGQKKNIASRALLSFHIASQIINDLKDFSQEYSQTRQSFGDVKNGVVTVPIKVFWDRSNTEDRKRLKKLFGKGTLNRNDMQFIRGGLRKYLVFTGAGRIALRYLNASLTNFRVIAKRESYPEIRYLCAHKAALLKKLV